MTYNTIASDETIAKTIAALNGRNISAEVVDTGAAARQKVLSLIPKGSEVMNGSSVTLETIGLVDAFNKSGDYDSVKNKLMKLDRKTQNAQMQKLGAAPSWIVGSVHAVTQDGEVLIASNTGSQLPGYVYGSEHVIWVVGAQKIVATREDAFKRVYDYVLPLEDKHMLDLYNMHSNVSKLLLFTKEIVPNRVHLIFVKEVLGF
jgi:hypothetical protein